MTSPEVMVSPGLGHDFGRCHAPPSRQEEVVIRMLMAASPLRWCRPCRGRTLPLREKWLYVVYRGRMITLHFRPWAGICWRAIRKPGDPRRGFLAWEVQRGRPEMKKKDMPKSVAEGRHLAAMETDRFADMMPIVEHLAVTKYEDGDPRETGIIILKTNGVAYQAIIKDNDTGLCFTASGKSLDEAFETAALYLGTDSAPWEVDRYAKKGGQKKKK